ncbi:MAG: type II/IV secretion system ATPase subunit [Candidatus Bathyarchaeia archaeon]
MESSLHEVIAKPQEKEVNELAGVSKPEPTPKPSLKPKAKDKLRLMETLKPSAIFSGLPKDATILEEYWIREPYAKVTIALIPSLGGAKAYYITEAELTPEEEYARRKLIDILSRELQPPEGEVEPKAYLIQEARRLQKKYKEAIGELDEASWDKVMYYVERDLTGFGPIHVPMNDPMIEDISANGVGIPIYIWHRRHESMPTNLTIVDSEAMSDFIVKLAHMAGKHVSTAFPIIDAMLPGQHRLAATFREEVSPKGSTFTIRKFRAEPFSIVDLIDLGTMDERLAAYFWLLLEHRATLIVIGGTGAGKTSTLNALASIIKPSMKIVTVEEIPELNLPHENWVQLVARESYGLGLTRIGEVSLFNLVRTALRYRPDYVTVGEVRGEEAFVLFQAIATGHGGMCTIHADSVDYAVKRLTSPPMNVAEIYIPLMNIATVVERVQLPIVKASTGLSFGRRLTSVMEVADYGDYRPIAVWNPKDDTFVFDASKSFLIERLAARLGKEASELHKEIDRRAIILREMNRLGIRRNVEVARRISQFYANPEGLLKDLRALAKAHREALEKIWESLEKEEKEKEKEKGRREKAPAQRDKEGK